jgi:N-acetylglucosamine kinase-like BadF-type ATPase
MHTSPLIEGYLGLDAGGTQTRWAVVSAAGELLRGGVAPGLSGLMLQSEAGQADVATVLHELSTTSGPLMGAVVGMTGFDTAQAPILCELMARCLALPASRVQAMSDIELACLAAFAPGQGIVVYAGTGSVAAHLDLAEALHRVGGRGAIIDDAGGGHWIAREALRQVWRAEEDRPGCSKHSALAQALFEAMGGSDWAHTRQWVYGATRGELGTLALAVARAAATDPAALALLQAAGVELARLAQILLRRHGPLPVALVGRVFDLHPAIQAQLREALPADSAVSRPTQPAQVQAAQIAAKSAITSASTSTSAANAATNSAPRVPTRKRLV